MSNIALYATVTALGVFLACIALALPTRAASAEETAGPPAGVQPAAAGHLEPALERPQGRFLAPPGAGERIPKHLAPDRGRDRPRDQGDEPGYADGAVAQQHGQADRQRGPRPDRDRDRHP